jgi:hypothetical protein
MRCRSGAVLGARKPVALDRLQEVRPRVSRCVGERVVAVEEFAPKTTAMYLRSCGLGLGTGCSSFSVSISVSGRVFPR